MVVHPEVVAVTVNWKRAGDTIECVRSLFADGLRDVIVVDNGSNDGSVEQLRIACPQATVLEMGSNLGYAKGLNQGLRVAIERGPKRILIINNDAVIVPKFMDEISKCFERHPSAGILGPKTLYYDSRKLWFAGGHFNRFLGFTTHPFMDEDDLGQGVERKVDYINGCAMMVKASVFDEIGLFDEDFAMYAEDLDFCLRAEGKGIESWYCPEAAALHKVSSTAGEAGSNVMTPMRSYFYARNMLMVLVKRQKGMKKVTSLAGQFLVSLPYYTLLIASQRKKGALPAYWRGLYHGIVWSLTHRIPKPSF